MLALKVAAGVDSEKARLFAARLMARPHSLVRLKLTINDNQTSLVNARPALQSQAIPTLSVHWIFLDCDDSVLDALLGMLTSTPKPEHSNTLRYYIDRYYTATGDSSFASIDSELGSDENRDAMISKALRRINLCSRGVVYDLHTMMQAINEEYFVGKLSHLRVTWMNGVRELNKNRRGVLFGSYDARLQLVRLHPCLDSKEVPEYFVQFVLYHEMLHALLDPPRRPGKRHVVHTQRFRMLENRFRHYTAAKQYEAHFVRTI